VVALPSKNARTLWAVMWRGERFNLHHVNFGRPAVKLDQALLDMTARFKVDATRTVSTPRRF